MQSKPKFVVAALLLGAGLLSAQQPNSNDARLLVNAFDDGVYPLAAPVASPGTTALSFRASPGAPFMLFSGAVNAGHADLGPIGLVDVDLGGPDFTIWANGFLPSTPLDLAAHVDGTGVLDVAFGIPAGLQGPLTTLQAVMLAPSTAEGVRLAAASTLVAESGLLVTAVNPGTGPAAGGTTVEISGSGFTVGFPVTVLFDGVTAPSATITGPTSITCVTPAGAVGMTVSVTVQSANLVAVLYPGFTYVDPLATTPPVIINEVFTGTPDFVELLNPHQTPVDLSGFKLDSWYHGTTPDAPAPFVIPTGTILMPGQTLVIEEFGIPGVPGTLPGSISCGYNLFWVGARQVEVVLMDPYGTGVDYVTRRWTGYLPHPHLPPDLAWTGDLTGIEDGIARHALIDTDSAADITLRTYASAGSLNPGQSLP